MWLQGELRFVFPMRGVCTKKTGSWVAFTSFNVNQFLPSGVVVLVKCLSFWYIKEDMPGKWHILLLCILAVAFLAGATPPPVEEVEVERAEPEGALAWFKQGVELAQKGEFSAALARFKKANLLAPNWALPCLEIAVAHMKTDNNRKVIGEYLEKAVKLGKSIPRAHYLWGIFLQEDARRDEAVGAFTRSLQLRPSLVDARFRLATLYVEAGRQAEGIHQYQLVLKQRPNHLGAHRNLAVLYEQSGQLEEAEEHLKAIATMHPYNAYHLSTLGRFYERVGWDSKAKATFRQAERLDPSRDSRRLRPLPKSRNKQLKPMEF
jgi:tetratricopeptide (TPR) repeat protein